MAPARSSAALCAPTLLCSMYFSRETRREFFDAYVRDGNRSAEGNLVQDADAMVCSHPTGMCELAMPFNRSIILWATTRFEQGRERNADRLSAYIRNVRAIAARPGNILAANNMYDVHYLRCVRVCTCAGRVVSQSGDVL